eukprot:TRINITY_DN5592_c0_g3_i1.p1 TRINITY_DN5592_c0_g3~~TRINITY_DN5592_c0_g3_i1.p1  ORF type:complete len:336 (+),score=39.49 TRINITY_DN5592_c0_g3_i1:176-1183(+)
MERNTSTDEDSSPPEVRAVVFNRPSFEREAFLHSADIVGATEKNLKGEWSFSYTGDVSSRVIIKEVSSWNPSGLSKFLNGGSKAGKSEEKEPLVLSHTNVLVQVIPRPDYIPEAYVTRKKQREKPLRVVTLDAKKPGDILTAEDLHKMRSLDIWQTAIELNTVSKLVIGFVDEDTPEERLEVWRAISEALKRVRLHVPPAPPRDKEPPSRVPFAYILLVFLTGFVIALLYQVFFYWPSDMRGTDIVVLQMRSQAKGSPEKDLDSNWQRVISDLKNETQFLLSISCRKHLCRPSYNPCRHYRVKRVKVLRCWVDHLRMGSAPIRPPARRRRRDPPF